MIWFEKLVAVSVIVAWPVIPIYWLPMRLWPGLKKTLGPFYLIVAGLIWLLVALALWSNLDSLLGYQVDFPSFLRIFGLFFLILGLLLQIAMAFKLGRRIAGIHELTGEEACLETSFPFNLCRHPTYLSHFMMFFGAAVFSGYLVLFLIALLDVLITIFLMIPREESELERRFGKPYLQYRQKTNMILPDFNKLFSFFFRNGKHA